ncbi:hypothetical protein HIM_10967 [Hirsutella minnesotensis 3608]|uniref:Cation-transporting P-type ATPase C-terminal domain-containing protein n=1 Tax=Hirsutella minnesotensis 3608 TaxID=1043627 RepID=A0A0F7ZFS5_9HYPO|nr:hypothetical protein HIM_10967 [Hirsutella minnesotensis 3608]
MGNATVICSDKTGTLTENAMTVVSGALGDGAGLLFGDENLRLDSDGGARILREIRPEQKEPLNASLTTVERRQLTRISMDQLSSKLDTTLKDLLKTAVAVNTTAFEGDGAGGMVFVGTKTETALLDWARRYFGLGPVSIERANNILEQLFPFNSRHKCMGAIIQLPETDSHMVSPKYRLFAKGAPEIILAHCTSSLDDPSKVVSKVSLQACQKDAIKHVMFGFAAHSLRTLALAYRDFEHWPPHRAQTDDTSAGPGDVVLADVLQDMTWIGVVGIRDPVRPGVPAAVEDCRTASVSVKMVTGDNIETARAVGRECGILTTLAGEDGLVMEGQDFRRLSDEKKAAISKNLCVLARSSPEDKRMLVKILRDPGEIVALRRLPWRPTHQQEAYSTANQSREQPL